MEKLRRQIVDSIKNAEKHSKKMLLCDTYKWRTEESGFLTGLVTKI